MLGRRENKAAFMVVLFKRIGWMINDAMTGARCFKIKKTGHRLLIVAGILISYRPNSY